MSRYVSGYGNDDKPPKQKNTKRWLENLLR
jgi:hypothetical protein